MTQVLVVDDDDPTRETVRVLLEEAGYTVEEAATAQAALDALQANPDPQVVLFDYLMPRMSGEELVRAAERVPTLLARHAFLCVTASPTRLSDSFSTWLEQYHVPVLAKPFDMDDLLALVAQAATHLRSGT